MPQRRTWTDDDLRSAAANSRSWAEVVGKLGLRQGGGTQASVKRVAADLGVDLSHMDGQSWLGAPLDPTPLPWVDRTADRRSGGPAEAVAIAWFTDRGYVVSLPLRSTSYDLIVESDDGLKKVQVKGSTFQRGAAWVVTICRTYYNGGISRGAYRPGDADYYFVVTGDGAAFLFPEDIVLGKKIITISKRYAQFRVLAPDERRGPVPQLAEGRR